MFFSMLLLCSFFRLKELFQVKNGLTTSLLFFENAKNLGRSDDAKRRKKKEDGLILTGKRDSRRRHSTTNFSENVLVAETSYQIIEVLHFANGRRLNFRGNKGNSADFSGEKKKK